MRHVRKLKILVAISLLVSSAFGVAVSFGASTPEETLKSYLAAMKEQKFDEAYKHISKAMAGNKDSEAWAKEYKYIFQTTEMKIFKYEVFPGKVEGETAKVPNLMSSQDKILNTLGVDEYELYTLVKENGEWKVDQQEEIVEKSEQAKWFTKKGS